MVSGLQVCSQRSLSDHTHNNYKLEGGNKGVAESFYNKGVMK